MDYIAVLNYEHLDNSLFLSALARAISRKKSRGILLHADSEYTNRIIQTGVMRENAELRAMKELNHRLIALFADEGVPAIGLNGYQKSLIRTEGEEIVVDRQQLMSLPEVPLLVISSLCDSVDGNTPISVPLAKLAEALCEATNTEYLTLFSIDDQANLIKQPFPETSVPENFPEKIRTVHISSSFHTLNVPVRLTTPDHF